MASLLDFLDPESFRGMSQSFNQGGVSRGMSANAIQDMLQEVGLGYRRTTMLDDVRHWKAAFTKGEQMKFTTMDSLLGSDRYMETSWRMGSRYETLFRAPIKDPLTGEVVDKFVTIKHQHKENGIDTNDLTQTKTRGELQERAEQYYARYDIERENIVGPIVPVMGFYNPSVF